jgi:hypothetical protein
VAVTVVAAVATTGAADILAAVPTMVAAEITVAGGLMAEEAPAEAAAFVVDQPPVVRERAAAPPAGPKLAAIPVGSQIVRRMFVPQSPMVSGIRLAMRAVPRVPVPAVPRLLLKHAIPETPRTQASQEASPVSPAEPPELRQASVEVGMVGEAAMVGAAVAMVGEAVLAGEVGVGVSDGHTGDLAGDLVGGSAGILGCTTPTGMLQWLTPTRITATMGPTIRRTVRVRRQIRHITMTSRQAT